MTPPDDKRNEADTHPFMAFYDLAMAEESALGDCGEEEPMNEGLPPSPEQPGLVIAGRYVLKFVLGEGGTGQVWAAEQTEPVRREVAVKIIRPGLLTKPVSARFNREHLVLARMEHPNIAAVFDAGELPDGRTYFVMEVVAGAPITAWCRRHGLSVRQRLEIFSQACMAVHHAHQKGILHRDLKPSNVMVTEVDGRPVVKVIDFGIARTLAGDLSMGPDVTLHGMVLGTPRYMSPEQAGLTGQEVDARTDVYALGVLLYELLTGTTPIPEDGESADPSLPAMLQRVRQAELELPSRRVAQSVDLSAVSQTPVDTKALARQLRGELDWITTRALQKARDLRYATAQALAEDVRRFLQDEPISAGPPGLTYRVKKWLTRHRGALTTAGAVVLSLAGGLAATWWALGREEAQRRDAVRLRQVAVNESDLARLMSAQLDDLLDQAARDAEAGMNTQMLRRMADECAAGMARFATQPKAELRLADQLVRLYSALQEPARALPWAQRRWQLTQQLEGAQSWAALQALYELSWRRIEQGQPKAAVPLLRQVVAGYQALPEAETSAGIQSQILYARKDLARALSRAGQDAEAVPLMAEVIRDVGEADPTLTARWLRAQAEILRNAGRRDEAMAAVNRALALLAPREDQVDLRSSLLGMKANLSAARERYEEALEASAERVRVLEQTVASAHPQLINALISHATLACKIPGCPGGEAAARRALSLAQSAGHESRLAAAWITLAETLRVQGQYAASEQALRDALAEVRRTQAEKWRLLELHRRLGDLLTGRRAFIEARAEYDIALAGWFTDNAEGRAPEEEALIFASFIEFWRSAAEGDSPLPEAAQHLAEWQKKRQDWETAHGKGKAMP